MIVAFITNFGDLAVLLPLIAVIALWLAVARQPVTALWWVTAVSLCGSGTAVLKMYFYVCPLLSDLHSPSGHTALGTLVYGGVTCIVATDRKPWQRDTIAVSGGFFIAAIGLSRVLVEAHSVVEVLFGLALGGATLSLFVWAYCRDHKRVGHLRPLLLACIAIMLLLNGNKLRAEDMLHQLALHLNVARVGCVA